jgi:hypothetical protein
MQLGAHGLPADVIIVIDSGETPQWLVSPPNPRHFIIERTKSNPNCSARTATVRFRA